MMTIGGTAHIFMVICLFIIGILLFFIVRLSSEKIQNIIIYVTIGVCITGIFFLHATHYGTDLDLKNFLIQMLQVCNFNFILLILCLFKRNELARQYLFFFSMPMALSTFVSYPSDVEGSKWWSIVSLTFWINHFLIALVPILMISARKFKPKKEYIYKVILSIFAYFLIAFIFNYILNGFSIDGDHNHSYTMGPDSIMLLEPMFKLIPVPFVYLLPMVPILTIVYWFIAKLFEKYNINDTFGLEIYKKGEFN